MTHWELEDMEAELAAEAKVALGDLDAEDQELVESGLEYIGDYDEAESRAEPFDPGYESLDENGEF